MGFLSARHKANMTQGQVAVALGVHQSAVCLWETNKTKPRADLLLKIAKLYACSIDELLSVDKLTK